MGDVLVDPTSLTKLGVVGLLALALTTTITAFVREWVIPGASHLKQMAEKDVQIGRLHMERAELMVLLREATSVAEGTQRARGGGFVGRRKEPS